MRLKFYQTDVFTKIDLIFYIKSTPIFIRAPKFVPSDNIYLVSFLVIYKYE